MLPSLRKGAFDSGDNRCHLSRNYRTRNGCDDLGSVCCTSKGFGNTMEIAAKGYSAKAAVGGFWNPDGNILHYRHVEALNLIDVDFSDPSEKDIRDA